MEKIINPRILAKKETSKRRKEMRVVCYELKIQNNKLSANQKEKLPIFFSNAKWIINRMLNCERFDDYDYKSKTVLVKYFVDNVAIEETKDVILPSQMKQSLQTKLYQDASNLAAKKKKGGKVGRLKFKKEVNCIPLKQYKVTWNFGDKKKMHVAGIGYVTVNGKDQISPEVTEWGAAKLIRCADQYFIHVTGFIPKTEELDESPNDVVGIDMGIKDSITLSTGEKFKHCFPEPSRLKKIQRNVAKKKKGSANRYRARQQLKKAYRKLTNKKDDVANKLVNKLKKDYKQIIIQDENLKGWKSGLFGKQVHHSCLGRIKSKLKKLNTTIVVDRYEPTTKLCSFCGRINDLGLEEREYKCECGFCEDRDIKSARTIATLGLLQVGAERIDSKPVEILTSAIKTQYLVLFNFNSKLTSAKQEATGL